MSSRDELLNLLCSILDLRRLPTHSVCVCDTEVASELKGITLRGGPEETICNWKGTVDPLKTHLI